MASRVLVALFLDGLATWFVMRTNLVGGCPRIARGALGQIQSLVAKRVGIRVRRKRGSHILRSGEHRAFRVPEYKNRTLWTLTCPRFESVFFASFLCR